MSKIIVYRRGYWYNVEIKSDKVWNIYCFCQEIICCEFKEKDVG